MDPTTTRRIIDLDRDATNAFLGMVAAHFAHNEVLDRATVEKYLAESQAVTS